MVGIGTTLVDFGTTLAEIGPNLAEIGPMLIECGGLLACCTFRAMWVEFGRSWAIGRFWATFGRINSQQIWPSSSTIWWIPGHIWSSSAQDWSSRPRFGGRCLNSADCGQVWPNFGPSRHNFGRIRPMWAEVAEFGPNPVKVNRKCADAGPNLVDSSSIWPMVADIWSSSAQSQNKPKSGRSEPSLGRDWPTSGRARANPGESGPHSTRVNPMSVKGCTDSGKLKRCWSQGASLVAK